MILGASVVEHGRSARHCDDTGGPPGARRAAGATDRGPTAEFFVEWAHRRMAAGRRIGAGLRRAAVVGPHHRSARGMSTAAVLLAVALWIGPGPSVVRACAGIPSGAHQRRGLLPAPKP